ncbi:hypothetical protein Tco_0352395 [Tanacetum coccineum]
MLLALFILLRSSPVVFSHSESYREIDPFQEDSTVEPQMGALETMASMLQGSHRLELHQLDTFYNALNINDQDSLNSAAGGNFLDKMPRECLKIIESKSKAIVRALLLDKKTKLCSCSSSCTLSKQLNSRNCLPSRVCIFGGRKQVARHYCSRVGSLMEIDPLHKVPGWGLCIDFRKLNEATAKNPSLYHSWDQMRERLGGLGMNTSVSSMVSSRLFPNPQARFKMYVKQSFMTWVGEDKEVFYGRPSRSLGFFPKLPLPL